MKQSRKKKFSRSSTDEDDLEMTSLKTVKSEQKRKIRNKSKRPVKFKIKTKLKFPMNDVRQKTVKIMNQENKKTEIGRVEITTGKGLAVPICEGEEIVKISKDYSDSDVEIDVEDSDDIKPEIKITNSVNKELNTEVRGSENIVNEPQKVAIDLSVLEEPLVKELTNLEYPDSEVIIKENFITELEKVIHSEFFEGRPTKTPLRYLKVIFLS